MVNVWTKRGLGHGVAAWSTQERGWCKQVRPGGGRRANMSRWSAVPDGLSPMGIHAARAVVMIVDVTARAASLAVRILTITRKKIFQTGGQYAISAADDISPTLSFDYCSRSRMLHLPAGRRGQGGVLCSSGDVRGCRCEENATSAVSDDDSGTGYMYDPDAAGSLRVGTICDPGSVEADKAACRTALATRSDRDGEEPGFRVLGIASVSDG